VSENPLQKRLKMGTQKSTRTKENFTGSQKLTQQKIESLPWSLTSLVLCSRNHRLVGDWLCVEPNACALLEANTLPMVGVMR